MCNTRTLTKIWQPRQHNKYNTSELALLSILCILKNHILIISRFNYAYRNKQNIYWQSGLYTFIQTTPWGWHLGSETCGIYAMHMSKCICGRYTDHMIIHGTNNIKFAAKYKACPSESGTDKFIQTFIWFKCTYLL
jgi:hypothetical protein